MSINLVAKLKVEIYVNETSKISVIISSIRRSVVNINIYKKTLHLASSYFRGFAKLCIFCVLMCVPSLSLCCFQVVLLCLFCRRAWDAKMAVFVMLVSLCVLQCSCTGGFYSGFYFGKQGYTIMLFINLG